DDHVVTSGHILATDGGRIDLREGLFVHEGTVDLGDGQLIVMNGQSGISSGQLAGGSMTIGTPLAGIVNPDGTLTTYPPGLFRQTGGTAVFSEGICVKRGRYELHGGTLSTRGLELGGVWLISPDVSFVQTGGTCKISGILGLGGYLPGICNLNGTSQVAESDPVSNVIFPDIIEIPAIPKPDTDAVPTYQLSGGQLSVGSLMVGRSYNNLSPASFIQTGGMVDIQSELSVNGRDSIYTIFDGSLTVPVLEIGAKYARSGGTLAILSRRAEIEVSQRLSFGAGSTFVAVPGATIHITGSKPETSLLWPRSTFGNFSTDPAALAGLGNLKLIFEGGNEFVATFEVAGEDRGPDLGSFFENFVLDTLQIGGEDVAMVQLVDLFDNQPGWEGCEALYVENLILGAGSTLDLNGLNIYYLNFTDLGGNIVLEGGSVAQIPEPATLALLVIGGVLCLARRRRD
ncbi:MAG: PEP-CTERM sorting domain-containing protein, partial [Planctomycetota bacterium]|nr:PEP-CTERM sorting domain-containing protein [Planctomycetota bacterium]